MPARRAAASTAVPPLPPLPLLLAAAAAGWMVWSPGALASNWAQVSGPKQQNTAKVPKTLFSPRYGMAAVALLENAPLPCLTPEQVAALEAGEPSSRVDTAKGYQKILVMGGDTYIGGTGQHEGGYLNDVWAFGGAQWETYLSPLANHWRGYPMPTLVSKIQWTQLSYGYEPPAGVTYKTALACAESRIRYRGMTALKDSTATTSREASTRSGTRACTVGAIHSVSRTGAECGPHGATWALCRSAAACSFLGGVRVDSSTSPTRSLLDRCPPTRRSDRWREKSLLYNDVWRSEDGEKWDMVSPGCDPFAPQNNLIIKNGHHYALCKSDLDCYGVAKCNLTVTSYAAGTHGICTCQMWSPR